MLPFITSRFLPESSNIDNIEVRTLSEDPDSAGCAPSDPLLPSQPPESPQQSRSVKNVRPPTYPCSMRLFIILAVIIVLSIIGGCIIYEIKLSPASILSTLDVPISPNSYIFYNSSPRGNPFLEYPDRFIIFTTYGRWGNRYLEIIGASKLALATNRTVILQDYVDEETLVSLDDVYDLTAWNRQMSGLYYQLYGHHRNETTLRFPEFVITFRMFLQFLYPNDNYGHHTPKDPLPVHVPGLKFALHNPAYESFCLNSTDLSSIGAHDNSSKTVQVLLHGVCDYSPYGFYDRDCTTVAHCSPFSLPFLVQPNSIRMLPKTLPAFVNMIQPYHISVLDGSVPFFISENRRPLSAELMKLLRQHNFFTLNYKPFVWAASIKVIRKMRMNYQNRLVKQTAMYQLEIEKRSNRTSVDSICIHLRQEDYAHLFNLDSFLSQALNFVVSLNISSNNVFITTNANQKQLVKILETFPLATIECEPRIFQECRNPVSRFLVNQGVCSLTSYFLGSPLSSFTRLIQHFRRHENNLSLNMSRTVLGINHYVTQNYSLRLS